MKDILNYLIICALAATGANAAAIAERNPPGPGSGVQVDLGYSVYVGQHNSTTNINTFLG
jgi:hypothetical protein